MRNIIKFIGGWLYLFAYQISNWRAHARSLFLGRINAGGNVVYKGVLTAAKIKADGSKQSLGVLGTRVVTNAAVTFMRDDFNDGASDINLFNYHDSGTGAVAEAVGDTALGTAAGPARVAGTKSVPAANQYRSVATIAYTATLAITEHGLFSASTAGTLWDRTVFAAVNVVSGESIQYTYTLTITAGG
jgi:hypothetical protein